MVKNILDSKIIKDKVKKTLQMLDKDTIKYIKDSMEACIEANVNGEDYDIEIIHHGNIVIQCSTLLSSMDLNTILQSLDKSMLDTYGIPREKILSIYNVKKTDNGIYFMTKIDEE